MNPDSRTDRPFTLRFTSVGSKLRLEISNTTDQTMKGIEILTVFLKSGPIDSAAVHLRFEDIASILPQSKVIVTHRTWIDGRSVNDENDQLHQLKIAPGESSPYVLDLSWQNAEGKTRFQRVRLDQLTPSEPLSTTNKDAE